LIPIDGAVFLPAQDSATDSQMWANVRLSVSGAIWLILWQNTARDIWGFSPTSDILSFMASCSNDNGGLYRHWRRISEMFTVVPVWAELLASSLLPPSRRSLLPGPLLRWSPRKCLSGGAEWSPPPGSDQASLRTSPRRFFLGFSVVSIPPWSSTFAASMPCWAKRDRTASLSPGFMPSSLWTVAIDCDPSLFVTRTRLLAVLAAIPSPPGILHAFRIINSK